MSYSENLYLLIFFLPFTFVTDYFLICLPFCHERLVKFLNTIYYLQC